MRFDRYTTIVNDFAARLPRISEADADAAFLAMSRLRDRLVIANEGPAAEHVESAIQSLQEVRSLLRPRARYCDDCDFTTEEGDVTICPYCRGSVG